METCDHFPQSKCVDGNSTEDKKAEIRDWSAPKQRIALMILDLEALMIDQLE
jgi:hypothetical protein